MSNRACSPDDPPGVSAVFPTPFILAYDSDDDERVSSYTRSPFIAARTVSPAALKPCPLVSPATIPLTDPQVSAEDSQLSAAGGRSPDASRTPASAAKARTPGSHVSLPLDQHPPPSLRSAEASALAAQQLLHINATTHVQKERDAALAQLSRFRGAYKDLCRGAPFSVWVRYEPQSKAVVDETLNFFQEELTERLTTRDEGTQHMDAQRAARKADIVSVRLPGFRMIGSRAPLPACRTHVNRRAGASMEASHRHVCELHGTWSQEDAEREEDARLYATLSHGERAAISLMSMEEQPASGGGVAQHSGSRLSSAAGLSQSPYSTPSQHQDALSPLSIYAEDHAEAPTRPVVAVVPFHEAPACAPLREDTSLTRARDHLKRSRGGSALASGGAARRLEFDSSNRTAAAPPLTSLSGAVMERRNQRVLQEWFKTSSDAYGIPY